MTAPTWAPRCEHDLRDGPCDLTPGHRGRHSTVAFECDGCGRRRRGQPFVRHEEAGWFCFLCVEVGHVYRRGTS